MRGDSVSRRAFIQASLGTAGTILFGCDGSVDARDASTDAPGDTLLRDAASTDTGTPDAAHPDCPDPFAGGARLGLAAFVTTRVQPFATPFDVGLDARMYTDLSTLTPEMLVIPTERFFIRSQTPDRLDLSDPARVRATWRIAVGGLAMRPRDVALSEILPLVAPLGTTLIECSGNSGVADFGLMSVARWSGVPLTRVLAMVDPLPQARRVLVSGFDDYSTTSTRSRPGASWIFTLDDLARYGAWLVTEMNGAPLPPDHGFPVRLVVPRWYGCCCIKWVNEIRLVDDDAPATDHMLEFASRTQQDGAPTLARDFRPAAMEHAAMPVRVERWRVGGSTVYKVVGILWGGAQRVDALEISFDSGVTYAPVAVCPSPTTNDTWTLWSYAWSPRAPGQYAVRLRVADRSVPTRRLDAGYYTRLVEITEV